MTQKMTITDYGPNNDDYRYGRNYDDYRIWR